MPRSRIRSSVSKLMLFPFLAFPFLAFPCLLLAPMASVSAQEFDLGKFQLPGDLNPLAGGIPTPGIQVESHVAMWEGSNIGLLTIQVTLNESWKVYSLTQRTGGPTPTKIHLNPSDDFRLLGSFSPNRPPKVEQSEIFEMQVESFAKDASWSVPIEITGSSSNLVVTGYLDGLACAEQCVPFGKSETEFEARVTTSMPTLLDGKRIDGTHAHVLTWLSTAQAAPGDSLQLFVAFRPDPNWHVYAYDKIPPSMYQKPTLVQANLPDGWKTDDVRSSAAVISKKGIIDGEPPVREYVGPATIAFPIKIPADAGAGKYPITGHVAFQTCATQCDRPTAFAWNVELEVTDTPAKPRLPRGVTIGASASYDDVVAMLEPSASAPAADTARAPSPPPMPEPAESVATNAAAETTEEVAAVFDLANLEFDEQAGSQTNLATALFYAFVGGFILNFMPCVLPVIGLKIMSFVEQAGSDRAQIFKLNAWYVLGMLAIFWVLALLAAAPALGLTNTKFGWGEQFNSQAFNISLVGVIFVMALSFLGVWEIPIPGFATASKATELASQEGLSGAFFKGSITTILATPCSGPGLVTAYAFAVNSGSPTLPFLIFTVMGLGMGVPYLIIGAFPSLVTFLPKPGAWMDTFKQLMGFVLLGTVIFLMENISFENLLPTTCFLFGLWFACWWIGSLSIAAPANQRLRAWAIAVIIGMVGSLIAFGDFGLLGRAKYKLTLATDRAVSEAMNQEGSGTLTQTDAHEEDELPWEPFNQDQLNQMMRNGETVMVDFTADWCRTCRVLEAVVLNTDPVRNAVKENGVRVVVADWGTKDPVIGELLDRLQGSRQIPFLAIFPAGHPEKVIRFSGSYTQAKILNALEQAGRSQTSQAELDQVAAEQRTAAVSKKQPLP